MTFYDTKEIGEFPTRRKPISHHSPLTHRQDVIGFNEIFLNLTTLKLGVYMPVSYILPSRLSRYEDIYDTEVSTGGGKLKQIDCEKSLRSLMTVNLLKRLESSVASFRITLKKLQQIHLSTLSRIENFRKTGQDGTFADISATFEDASPDVEYAYRVDGHSWWRAFTRIAIPLAGPGIAAAGLLAFIFAWNNFVFALILASADKQPVTVGALAFVTASGIQYGQIAAAIVLSIMPTLALALYAQRWLVEGLSLGAVKG